MFFLIGEDLAANYIRQRVQSHIILPSYLHDCFWAYAWVTCKLQESYYCKLHYIKFNQGQNKEFAALIDKCVVPVWLRMNIGTQNQGNMRFFLMRNSARTIYIALNEINKNYVDYNILI